MVWVTQIDRQIDRQREIERERERQTDRRKPVESCQKRANG